MYVILFFILAVAVLGIRVEESRGAHTAILVLSALCATALYSFRFA